MQELLWAVFVRELNIWNEWGYMHVLMRRHDISMVVCNEGSCLK